MTAIALELVRPPGALPRVRYAVEAIGTFCLLTMVGLAVSTADPFAALVLGAVLLAMMYAGGQFAGGHFNPAITLAALLRGRIELPVALGYWGAQVGAAVGAAMVWRLVVDPEQLTAALSMLLTGRALVAAAVAEFALVFVLGYVLLGVAPDRPAPRASTDLTVGFTLLAAAALIAALANGMLDPSGAGELFSFSTVALYLVSQVIAGAFAGIALLVFDATR